MAKKGNKTPKKFWANQWNTDPRQDAFLAYYLDPKSETWGNAFKSALKAKYSKEYAENIKNIAPQWLSENMEDSRLLAKAMGNLEEYLKTKKKDLQHIRWNATQLTLKGLGKSKWSERRELTGKDGKDLIVNIVKYAE